MHWIIHHNICIIADPHQPHWLIHLLSVSLSFTQQIKWWLTFVIVDVEINQWGTKRSPNIEHRLTHKPVCSSRVHASHAVAPLCVCTTLYTGWYHLLKNDNFQWRGNRICSSINSSVWYQPQRSWVDSKRLGPRRPWSYLYTRLPGNCTPSPTADQCLFSVPPPGTETTCGRPAACPQSISLRFGIYSKWNIQTERRLLSIGLWVHYFEWHFINGAASWNSNEPMAISIQV